MPSNPETCPVCDSPNQCRLALGEAYRGPCWCAGMMLPIASLNQKTKAFTLVEMLVVLAVVVVLASLLIPALVKGGTSAKRVQCLSQLRQLGLAAQLYWDDHEGLSFAYRSSMTPSGDLFWFGWLERGAEGSRVVDHRQGVLYPYLGGRGVELCPSLRYGSPGFKLKAIGAAYGYGYNLHLSPTPSSPKTSIGALKSWGQTALFADAAQVNTFQAPASPDHPMLEEFYYINAQEPTTHFRHQEQANVVFCDGHVSVERPAEGSLDPRLPRETLGRLRTELLRPK